MAPRMPHVYLVRHGQTEWSVNGRHTGTSDIPLTAHGEEVMKRTARKIVPDVIDPQKVSHCFVSPRKRAQVTADILFNSGEKKLFTAFETTDAVAEWCVILASSVCGLAKSSQKGKARPVLTEYLSTYAMPGFAEVNEACCRDYGAYEGMLTKDIKKIKPDWSIWQDGCPPSEEHPGGESVQAMQERVDGLISRIRAVHTDCMNRPNRDGTAQDIVIVTHGHFSRVFISRWCNLPLDTGYHLQTDAGSLTILGYQHGTLEEPSLVGLNWFSEDRS